MVTRCCMKGVSMIVKVREIVEGCMPERINVGDWIDLKTACDVITGRDTYGMIPHGIAVELPEGYEAHVVPRSSTFKAWGIIMANSMGIIDNSYCGDDDEWQFPYWATRGVYIPKGTRIAQFRIVPNQPDFELVQVESLGNDNRGGFGSTGR